MKTKIKKGKSANGKILIRLISPKHKTIFSGSKQWHKQNLTLAHLASSTPPDFDVEIVDEKESEKAYDKKADILGIIFESYTHYRAYEIADNYRKIGVPVILGGFHASHFPAEAQKHADTVVIGNVERAWPEMLHDFKNGGLKRFYRSFSSLLMEGNDGK